jgi:hypothetical protein
MGSLFIASYDSQGYGVGIRPTFTPGTNHQIFCTDLTANTASKNPILLQSCILCRRSAFNKQLPSNERQL